MDSDSALDLEVAFEDFGEAQPGDLFENEDGTLSTSGRHRGKVLVCHKGRRNIWVSSRAYRYHRRHGDTRGRCQGPQATTCPCFTAGDVAAAADSCSSTVVPACSMGDPYYLLLSCDPGGNVPPGVLGIYLSQTANGGSCSREDVNGTVTQNGLTDAEFEACVDVIASSGYCS